MYFPVRKPAASGKYAITLRSLAWQTGRSFTSNSLLSSKL